MAGIAQVRERRAAALAMRESGASVDEIREAMGYSTNRLVRHDIRKAREDALTARVRDPLVGGLPVDVLTSRDRRVHRMIEQHARRRHERLEGLLRASGLHVSQMTAAQLGSRVWSLEQYDG